MCQHQPACPPAEAPDHTAARVVTSHPEQGWSLLCNGVVVFDDTGELLPDRQVIAPHRPRTACRQPSPAIARRRIPATARCARPIRPTAAAVPAA